MSRPPRLPATLLLLAALALPACESERGSILFFFWSPAWGLLSDGGADGSLDVALRLPPLGRLEGLEVRVDGAPVLTPADGSLSLGRRWATGTLPGLDPGRHVLEASVLWRFLWIFDVPLRAQTWVERVALDRPEACEVLNDVECILPFPSSRYEEPADTETGVRVVFPDGVLPAFPEPIDSASASGQDGFSPGIQVLMHFPGGVDPELSGAPRLGPETRSADDTSLRMDSPTLLLDLDAGLAPVPHIVERDARAAGGPSPEREVLFLRPLETLLPGHRYVVAMRRLVHPDGTPVEAEAPFAALRDRRPTDIPSLRARRRRMERLFHLLEARGIERRDLVLAFDFVVQSRDDLTRGMLAMRDRAFAWLAEQAGPSFVVFPFAGPGDDPDGDVSLENDCSEPGERTWRRIRGTYGVPLFLSSDPLVDRVAGGRLVDDDGDGLPDAQGVMQAPYEVAIPCTLGEPGAPRPAPVLAGHGLFGNGRQIANFANGLGDVNRRFGEPDFQRVGAATDWLGLSSNDFSFSNPFADSFLINGVLQDVDNFRALPDRLQQGMTNALVLGRMLREGRFNGHPAFQRPDGIGVLPGPPGGLDFFGISLGGIMGTQLAALSPDVDRFALDIPGANFSVLIQRSAAIGLIELVINAQNDDPMAQAIFYGLATEFWDSAEPVGYLRHVVRDPLPGSGAPKDLLYTVAEFDGIVANLASEIAIRTLGLPNLFDPALPEGSSVSGLLGIEDVAPGDLPEGEDFVGASIWNDLGMYDLEDPVVVERFVPPLSNQTSTSRCEPHGRSFRSGAVALQVSTWLDEGVIESFCDGVCDAFTPQGDFQPFEVDGVRSAPCNPFGG